MRIKTKQVFDSHYAELVFDAADFKVHCIKNGRIELIINLPTLDMCEAYIDIYASGGVDAVFNFSKKSNEVLNN